MGNGLTFHKLQDIEKYTRCSAKKLWFDMQDSCYIVSEGCRMRDKTYSIGPQGPHMRPTSGKSQEERVFQIITRKDFPIVTQSEGQIGCLSGRELKCNLDIQ